LPKDQNNSHLPLYLFNCELIAMKKSVPHAECVLNIH
jgi:hypothetical protein